MSKMTLEPSIPVRTRFAPSPTGHLHIGGARTGLFSWLHARKHGGSFILRIENTDLQRSTAESINAILEGMTWLGLEYDEGPFYQSDRFERYREVIDRLLECGQAYRCECSKERLDALRAERLQRKEKPRYDGRCREREVGAEHAHVIRFRTPQEGVLTIDDMVQGQVSIANSELDDLIIQRSDGTPTYNLTVVVDDLDMRITHVIRGDDHVNNTPRQVHIIAALGEKVPHYAHVPMILGEDGSRLSKRHGALGVMQYREQGFLPEALSNYLVRLGWSHGDQEIFSLEELIALFEITNVNKAASTFNTEKLQWLNQHYIKTSAPEHIAHLLSPHFGQLGIDPSTGPSLLEVVKAQQERAKTLVEMAEISAFFYRDFEHYDEKSAKKHLTPTAEDGLTRAREVLAALKEWTPAALHHAVASISADAGVSMGRIAQPLRVAVVGRAASPGIDITLELLGRDTCLRRIDRALEHLRSAAARSQG